MGFEMTKDIIDKIATHPIHNRKGVSQDPDTLKFLSQSRGFTPPPPPPVSEHVKPGEMLQLKDGRYYVNRKCYECDSLKTNITKEDSGFKYIKVNLKCADCGHDNVKYVGVR